MVWRGLRRRCPRCGGHAFESWFRMKDHCDRCGLRFEREEGYWVGAIMINTTVTFGTFVGLFLFLVLVTWPDVPWGTVMGVTIVANAVIPVAFYPISKAIWLALELSWHPLEPEEIQAAAKRATLPEFHN
ncbi:MAG: DUF983 domain-containing protein [Acidimicrobiia bacterium]